MKPFIFPEEEQALLPWCPLKVCVMVLIPIAWILLKLSCFLSWHKAPAGSLAPRTFREPSLNFICKSRKFTHAYAHVHVEPAANLHVWLLTCASPQKTTLRFGDQQLLGAPAAVWQQTNKKKKLKVGFLFKSLFQIYQVKIVIRPPTCAHTYNPQLHCTFFQKEKKPPPPPSLS